MRNYENVLTTEQFEAYQEKFFALDLDITTSEEIQSYCGKMLDACKMTVAIKTPIQTFYRGIIWKDRPSHYNHLIYPPVEKAKVNRASEEGEQCFYCSDVKKTLFYELGAQVGDKIVVSSWRSIAPLILSSIGYSQSNLTELGGTRELDIIPLGQPLPEYEEAPKFPEREEFFCRQFCQLVPRENENLYKITTAIARLYYGDELRMPDQSEYKVHGLYYPSVKSKGNQDSYMFPKAVIDTGILEFDSVEYIELIKTDDANDEYIYKILDYSELLNKGFIKWKNLQNVWTLNANRQYYYNSGDETFSIYDEEMEEVQPDI